MTKHWTVLQNAYMIYLPTLPESINVSRILVAFPGLQENRQLCWISTLNIQHHPLSSCVIIQESASRHVLNHSWIAQILNKRVGRYTYIWKSFPGSSREQFNLSTNASCKYIQLKYNVGGYRANIHILKSHLRNGHMINMSVCVCGGGRVCVFVRVCVVLTYYAARKVNALYNAYHFLLTLQFEFQFATSTTEVKLHNDCYIRNVSPVECITGQATIGCGVMATCFKVQQISHFQQVFRMPVNATEGDRIISCLFWVLFTTLRSD